MSWSIQEIALLEKLLEWVREMEMLILERLKEIECEQQKEYNEWLKEKEPH